MERAAFLVLFMFLSLPALGKTYLCSAERYSEISLSNNGTIVERQDFISNIYNVVVDTEKGFKNILDYEDTEFRGACKEIEDTILCENKLKLDLETVLIYLNKNMLEYSFVRQSASSWAYRDAGFSGEVGTCSEI